MLSFGDAWLRRRDPELRRRPWCCSARVPSLSGCCSLHHLRTVSDETRRLTRGFGFTKCMTIHILSVSIVYVILFSIPPWKREILNGLRQSHTQSWWNRSAVFAETRCDSKRTRCSTVHTRVYADILGLDVNPVDHIAWTLEEVTALEFGKGVCFDQGSSDQENVVVAHDASRAAITFQLCFREDDPRFGFESDTISVGNSKRFSFSIRHLFHGHCDLELGRS